MSADRINYLGSALAALDQALNTDPSLLSRNDAAARAQAFALLAIADELRQLREARPSWPAADVAAHEGKQRPVIVNLGDVKLSDMDAAKVADRIRDAFRSMRGEA